MAHDTSVMLGKLENIAYTSPIGAFIDETDPNIDTIDLLFDLPLDPRGEETTIPVLLVITVTRYNDSGTTTVTEVEVESDQAQGLAGAATGSLAASGSLPRLYHDDSQTAEQAYGATDWVDTATGHGRFRVVTDGSTESWEYEVLAQGVNQTPVGNARIDQFALESYGGPSTLLPRVHPWVAACPEQPGLTHDDTDPWEGPNTANVPVEFDPHRGRIPGSDPTKVHEDTRLGLQRCLLTFVDYESDSTGGCC